MSGVVLTVVTVVVTEMMTVVVVTVVMAVLDLMQLPPSLRVSGDVLNTPPLVRQSDQQDQTFISNLMKHWNLNKRVGELS